MGENIIPLADLRYAAAVPHVPDHVPASGDLLADTPFNTYTRPGLPPTPIAMPGAASLRAAVRPDASKALYFVSRGNGTSEFSDTLAEHNRAVNKYQRGR